MFPVALGTFLSTPSSSISRDDLSEGPSLTVTKYLTTTWTKNSYQTILFPEVCNMNVKAIQIVGSIGTTLPDNGDPWTTSFFRVVALAGPTIDLQAALITRWYEPISSEQQSIMIDNLSIISKYYIYDWSQTSLNLRFEFNNYKRVFCPSPATMPGVIVVIKHYSQLGAGMDPTCALGFQVTYANPLP